MAAVPLLVRARVLSSSVASRADITPPRRGAAVVDGGDPTLPRDARRPSCARDTSHAWLALRDVHRELTRSATLDGLYAIAEDRELPTERAEGFGFARTLSR